MSAQRHWWTDFMEWRKARQQPTPQLAVPWQRTPNACPEHPACSMEKVTGPDGKPMWKCPMCGTDAMKPVQMIPRRPQVVSIVNRIRVLGMARDQLTAQLMKPLPPKPAWLQTHPDLPKLPPPSPHAEVQITMLPPTRHDLPHLTVEQKQEAISTLKTIPSRPLMPEISAVPTLHDEDEWLNDKKQSAPLPPIVAHIQYWTGDEIPQVTGALDELATLATMRHNSDTLEVPSYVKDKHEKKKESE